MKIQFNTYGNDKQKEAAAAWCDSTTSEAAYGGSKYSGKSYLGCSLAFGDAYIYPETNYFIARKNLNDLRKFTRATIHEIFDHWHITDKHWKFNGQDNYYELYNGSYVFLIGAPYLPNDPDFTRFGSINMTRGVLEEAGELTLKAKENLAATVGRRNNEKYNLHPKILCTCNPTKNFLYTQFYQPSTKGTLPSFRKFIQAYPGDNKRGSAAYLENLERSLTGVDRERLLLGNWDYAADPNSLIPDFTDIMDAFNCLHIIPDATGGALVTDLALRGRDKWIVAHTTGTLETGVCVRFMLERATAEAPDIEKSVRALAARLKIQTSKIVADSDGLGQYLGGYIKGIAEFHGGARASDPKMYDNIKTECAYILATLFNNGRIRIIPDSEEQAEAIRTELGVLRAELIDTEGQKELISKDEMKRILGHSPDFLDVLIMSMYPYVKRVTQGVQSFGF